MAKKNEREEIKLTIVTYHFVAALSLLSFMYVKTNKTQAKQQIRRKKNELSSEMMLFNY